MEKEKVKVQDLKDKHEEKETGEVVTPKRDRPSPKTVWLEVGSRTPNPTLRTQQKEKSLPPISVESKIWRKGPDAIRVKR